MAVPEPIANEDGAGEKGKTIGTTRRLAVNPQNRWPIASALLVIGCALYVIPCVAEVMSRADLAAALQAKHRELSGQLNYRVHLDLTEGRIRDIDDVKDRMEEYKTNIARINQLENLAARVGTLAFGGSISAADSVEKIAFEYHAILNAYHADEDFNLQETEDRFDRLVNEVSKKRSYLWIWLWPVYNMRSMYLIGLASILGGVIGTLVAGLRTHRPPTVPRDIALGIVTGFIAFLLIRGGKSVFLLDVGDHVPPLNPYSAVLSSLVGGLFSGRMFHLLSFLVEDFIGKVKAVSSHRNPPSERGNPQTLDEMD